MNNSRKGEHVNLILMSVFKVIIIKRLNDHEKPSEEGTCPYCRFRNEDYSASVYELMPMPPINGQYIIRRVLGAGGSEGELFVDGDGPEGEAIVGEGGAAAKAPFAGDNHLRNRFPSDGLCAC